jgi:hypothetical protein
MTEAFRKSIMGTVFSGSIGFEDENNGQVIEVLNSPKSLHLTAKSW